MNSILTRKRKAVDDEIDITPMIDMTFLLLIFFILTSKMDGGSDVMLPRAKHGVPITPQDSVVITVKSNGNAAEFYLADETNVTQKLPQEDADAFQAAVQDYVTRGLAAGGKQVLIRGSRDIKHREIDRLLRAIGGVEGASAYVAVLEENG